MSPPPPSAERPCRLLFVCVENSCRSQMAEAFARRHGGDRVEAYSAGSRPSGKVHPKVIEAMRERGIDLSGHRSKGLADVPDVEYDAVVALGCGDACDRVRARRREAWDFPAPKDLPPEGVRAVRDVIEARVKELLAVVRPPQPWERAGAVGAAPAPLWDRAGRGDAPGPS
jgi:arsenate reductase (thioredoxin)